MTNKSRAKYFRDYRARKRQAHVVHEAATPATTPATLTTPAGPVAHPELQPHGTRPSALATEGSAVALHATPPQQRRRRLKSDAEIRSHIATCMRSYGGQPKALLHLLTGYIVQLQDAMKRESEDAFVERVCQQRHPGQTARGLYCKLCHDVELAGRFGSIPGQPKGVGDLIYPSDDPKAPVVDDDPDDLDDVNIKPLEEASWTMCTLSSWTPAMSALYGSIPDTWWP